MKDNCVIYVFGKGGNALESRYYKKFFSNIDVIGIDYKKNTPWEVKEEIRREMEKLKLEYKNFILIANSIGAFFSMYALKSEEIKRAFFISPIANMENLIQNMMIWAGVTEKELQEKKIIKTNIGEDLSWEYLDYVRKNKPDWKVKTDVLYGELDNLTSIDVISNFVKEENRSLTIMKNGEHYFHTKEEMKFLDQWFINKLKTN